MKTREEIRQRVDTLLDLRIAASSINDVFTIDELDSELKVLSWVLGTKKREEA